MNSLAPKVAPGVDAQGAFLDDLSCIREDDTSGSIVNLEPPVRPLYFSGSHSNMGIVRALPHQSFSELVEQEICKPIPLENTKAKLMALSAAEANEAKKVKYLVPATFASPVSTRQTPLARESNLIFVDIDDPVEAQAILDKTPAALLGDLSAVVYHTARSLPTAPRLRVMVAANEVPVAQYAAAVKVIAGMLGLKEPNRESLVPVQPMYLPVTFTDDSTDPVVYAKTDGNEYVHSAPVSLPRGQPTPTPVDDEDIANIEFLREPMEGVTPELVEEALNKIDPDCSMQKWVEYGMGLKHQFGEAGYELWDSWSSKGKKYKPGETRKRWDSFSANTKDRHPVTLRSLIKAAKAGGWQPVQSAGTPWPLIVPLETPQPPHLDLDKVIPSSLPQFRAFVAATAEAVQVPFEAVALLCLGIISAAAGRSFEIRLLPQWVETAVLWIVLLAEPGERKSAVLSKLTAPLYRWQADEHRYLAAPLAAYREQRNIAEAQLAGLRRSIRSPKAANVAQLKQTTTATAQWLESTPELFPPELITADCTPEAQRGLLVRNGEKVINASAEADPQQITGSRYSKDGGQNLNLMLAGKTGDPLPGHRVSKSEPLARPAIAVVYFVQPAAVREVLRDSNTNGRGLVQRFILVHPPSRMGSRTLSPPPVDPALESWWDDKVRGILDVPWPGRVVLNQGIPARHNGGPQVLSLDPAADTVFSALRQNIENRLKDDGDLRPIASKLPGDIARIALALEVMQDPNANTVTGATMAAACHWAEYLIAHHKAVLGDASERPERRHARRLIASLERNPVPELSARDCLRRIQNTTDMTNMAELQPALNELVGHHYLRPLAADKLGSRGHPPSPIYEVNPSIYLI